MPHNVGILGCGWVGLPLALAAVKKSWNVKGSTTSASKVNSLRNLGVEPVLINFSDLDSSNLSNLLRVEQLVVTVPPGIRSGISNFYLSGLGTVIGAAQSSEVKKIFLLSSTGIYPAKSETFTEQNSIHPVSYRESILFQAENIVKDFSGASIILRCGGLMGYNRVPGRYFSGKKIKKSPQDLVNYIHRDDLVSIIIELLSRDFIDSRIYNIVAPDHPQISEVYKVTANKMGFPPPVLDESIPSKRKIVSSEKLQKDIEYRFRYPSPLQFDYQ